MNDIVYQCVMAFATMGWILLIVGMFIPSANVWRGRLLLIAGRVVPLVLAAVYAVLLVRGFQPVGTSGSDFERIAAMFQIPAVVLFGWVHYLAFDLFIGRWIVDDAQIRNLRQGWLLLPLVFTFLFGPIGLLLYFGLRNIKWFSSQHRVI